MLRQRDAGRAGIAAVEKAQDSGDGGLGPSAPAGPGRRPGLVFLWAHPGGTAHALQEGDGFLRAAVFLSLEFPGRDVVVGGPDAAAVVAGVLEGEGVAFVGAVAVEDPGPAVDDHFQFDVPGDALGRAEAVDAVAGLGGVPAIDGGVFLRQVGHGDDAAVTVENAAGVHLQEDGEVEGGAGDEMGEERLCFGAAGLIGFRCVDEAEPYCCFHACWCGWDLQIGHEAVAVEHAQDVGLDCIGPRIFRHDQERGLMEHGSLGFRGERRG